MDPREYDWQIGDLAAKDLYPDERGFQPTPTPPERAWPVPTRGMAPWPYQERPAQTETEMAQQAREAAAYQLRRPYQTAATRPPESNRLTAVAGAVGSIPGAMGELAAIPGRTIEPNPYPPGSEEADFYERARKSATYQKAPELAFNLMGGGTAFAQPGAAGMLGGRLSKTADLDKYRKAEEMLQYGKTTPEIRKETNWFPIGGSNLAYEIPDKGTGWIEDPSKLSRSRLPARAPAERIYNHPAAYEAYPDLRNIPVIIDKRLGKGVRGGFDPPEYVGDQPKVYIAPASSGAMRSVLGHELLGHGVQNLEQGQLPSGKLTGWSIGGNPANLLREMKPGTPQYDIYQSMAKAANEPMSFREYADLLKGTGLEATERSYNDFLQATALGRSKEIDDRLKQLAAHTAYRKGQGEEIARAIQVRMNFGPRKIKDVPFEQSLDTPFEQQIFIPRPPLKQRPVQAVDQPPDQMSSLADQSRLQLSQERPVGFEPGSFFKPKVAPEPYDFMTGRRPNAPYPQFAERYPETGPPTEAPKTNPKFAGETYSAKTLTPEAEEFAKTREKIVKEMRDEGYQPFFDPSQRFPAEFQKQPGPHADTAGALAAKQETIDRHLKAIDTPETRKALRDAYSKGLDLPDSQAWYYLGQVEKKMKQDLGEEAGAKRFRDQVATAMSATTTGMTPQQNLIMSQYLNHLKATGQPLPTASYQTPVTVGGQRTMPNVEAYKELFSGPAGPYETLQAQAFKNPKRADFAQAQMGNPNAFTVDEQMAHGMIRKDVPQAGTYGIITGMGREEAIKAGADPQRYQDVAWAGFKKMLEDAERIKKGKEPLGPGAGYQGKPMISEINDMIERTHRLTGMPRQEIWERGWLKNEIPLYGVGGLTAMGGLAAQDDYRQ